MYKATILRCVICTCSMLLCCFFAFSQNTSPTETIVLIKGKAKRVLMDSDGTILKIIKDEPHHMDGIFVDRPPIPTTPLQSSATIDNPPRAIVDTQMALTYDQQLLSPYSQEQITLFLSSYPIESKTRFVLKADVDLSDDTATAATIKKLQTAQQFINSRGFAKSRVRFDISEVPNSNANPSVTLAIAQ